MARPARQMELADAEKRDELLVTSLLQLVSYFAAQMQGAEQMRNQLILLAHEFGARPKDLSKASDLTATRIHQVIKQAKEFYALGEVFMEERALDVLMNQSKVRRQER